MVEPRPERQLIVRTGAPGWVIWFLALLTLVSLLLSAFLLLCGLYIYRQATPMVEAVAGMGSSLRQAVEDPLVIQVPIRDQLPVNVAVPLNESFEVEIDRTIPIDTILPIQVELPVIGTFSQDMPLHLDIPVDITVPVVLSMSVPISVNVPVSLTVPVVVDLRGQPLGDGLLQLGTVLEGAGGNGVEP